MKKLLLGTFCSAMIVLSLSTMFKVQAAENQNNPQEAPLLKMGVISDSHFLRGNTPILLTNALKQYSNIYTTGYDVLAVVGDLTDTGTVEEYNNFNQVIKKNVPQNIEKVMSIGNHEFFEARRDNTISIQTMKERFIQNISEYTETDKVYYDKWVNGYHMISLGAEDKSPNDWDLPLISNTQFNWLEEKLQEDADPNKPIFVFLHQPLDNTVYCSDEWGAGAVSPRLKAIMSKYPQVILFSGHTHCQIDHPRTVYQDKFTMVNTGAIVENDFFAGGNVFRSSSQGLFVEVYDQRVVIKMRDYKENKWINEYEIKVPFEKTIGESNPPTFPNNTLNAKKLGVDSYQLSWNPASDDTQVDKYIVKHIEGSKKETIKTIYTNTVSKNSGETDLSLQVSNLAVGVNHRFEVYAVDAWNNTSKTPISQTVSVESQFGWQKIDGQWYYQDSKGFLKNQFLLENGKYYYLTASGAMAVGWYQVGNQWYYFEGSGAMKNGAGWFYNGGTWYYLDSSGAAATGWRWINGSWYYFNQRGAMHIGWAKVDGKWYYLSSSGAMQKGWLLSGGKWYYLSGSGAMVSGWVQVSGTWYFMNESGAMLTGWVKDGQTWYYLNPNGAMKTGWLNSNGTWYYLSGSGAMQTGWLRLGSKWYYLQTSGAMVTGTHQINGITYKFDGSGAWIN